MVEVGQVEDLQVEAGDAGPLPPRPELVDDLRNGAPEVERAELVRLLADRLRPAGHLGVDDAVRLARDDEEVDRRPSSVGRYSPQHLRAIEEPVEPNHVHFVPKADFQDRFSEARDIGLAFRDNDIVTFDLSELDDVEATRYMDFAAGMAFALRGRIRQDGRSFTLIPDGVELPDTERDRMSV